MPVHDLPDLTEDIELMREAARKAGALALAYLKAQESLKSWDKSDASPVTEADLAVNTYLAEALRQARPDYGWLSEETLDDQAGRARLRTWVVDPIDGTRAFMRGNDPNWCIGIAIVEQGVAVAGVVYAPAHDEMYEASKGSGARLNGKVIHVTECCAEEGARLITNQTMIDHPAWPQPWPPVIVSNPKPNATLYRLALVASGRWDGMVVLFRKYDWDLAAGAILVAEAGGAVTTHLSEHLQFNRSVPAQRSAIAAGKALHALLIERVKHVDLPEPNA